MDAIKEYCPEYLNNDKYSFISPANSGHIIVIGNKTVNKPWSPSRGIKNPKMAWYVTDIVRVCAIFPIFEPWKRIHELTVTIELGFDKITYKTGEICEYPANSVVGDGFVYYKSIEPAFEHGLISGYKHNYTGVCNSYGTDGSESNRIIFNNGKRSYIVNTYNGTYIIEPGNVIYTPFLTFESFTSLNLNRTCKLYASMDG